MKSLCVKGHYAFLLILFFSVGFANTDQGVYFIEHGPKQLGSLYANGSTIELQTEIITWPMIGSDLTHVNLEKFKETMLRSRQAFHNDPRKIVVSGGPTRGLNIVFNVSSPPPGAAAALESVATYIESLFDDNVTVTINVTFASMGPGILGGTSNYYAGSVTWTNTRNGLVNGMDSNDTIQVWLPSGSTIPVRYTTGSTVTNETRCFFSRANYNATIGTVAGVAADMTFNTDFTWDYDPSNGITGGTICFQSVVAHETGHVLGFTSGADFRTNDIEALDVYRFQRSDGSGDYNPDNYSEFQTTARFVYKDNGSSTDDVNSDIISVEYRMSDGNPYQASHFSQGNVYAIMQPAISYGQTYYPDFYQTPDIDMFDAIGWDYPPGGVSYSLTINIVGSGSVTKNPDLQWFPESSDVELTAVPDSGWSFDHWSDDLSGSNNPDTLLMDDNKTVTAHFTQNQYTLTVNTVGSGSVIKNPDQATYTYGQEVELTAVPDSGWEFDHWSGGLTGSSNPDTITIDENETVTAHFVEAQYTLTINVNGSGSVDKNPDLPNYPYGTDVELTANSNTGWSFDHWSGALTGSQNPDTITMDDDKTVTAYFTQDHYTLTVVIDGNGSVTKYPDWPTYTYGIEVQLSAIADLGWNFDHWSGALTGSQNPDTVLMDSSKTVTAHFTQAEYTLTIDTEGNGFVEKDPDQTFYYYGDQVMLTAHADSGWVFDHWSGDLEGNENPDTITIDDDKTVTAYFMEEQYVIENYNEQVAVTFLDVFPNPFHDMLTIKYGIAQTGVVASGDVNIYSVTGQLIKRMRLPALYSTVITLTWDGRDNTGQKVSSGVYFLKFSAGDYEVTKQILLLR